MLQTVVDVSVPLLFFLLMLLVGLELTADDFRRVARRFPTVALVRAWGRNGDRTPRITGPVPISSGRAYAATPCR